MSDTKNTSDIMFEGCIDLWVRDSRGMKPTVKSIKQFVEQAERFGIPEDTELQDCVLFVSYRTLHVEVIEDIDQHGHNDVLLIMPKGEA